MLYTSEVYHYGELLILILIAVVTMDIITLILSNGAYSCRLLDSLESHRYTHPMRRQRIFILLLLLLVGLVACSPGHVGSNEIAFVRDGHLWTIDPDGANAFAIVTDSQPVIGYGWSPTHQILVFRTLDAKFATTSAAKHIVSNPITQLPGDLPSTLNTIGIDGGSPIPIIFSSLDIQYSNAWWNTSGNRLIYREEQTSAPHGPTNVLWWVSQNDQPGGIARKLLPSTFSIPSMNSSSLMAIGNSKRGVFATTLAGTNTQYIIQNELPGHPLPASLERVLWQPAHDRPDFLYAVATSSHQLHSSSTSTTRIMVQLVLHDMQGHATALTTCACTQFAWSPDGNSILYSIGSTYTLFSLKDGSSFSLPDEDGSVPYWSPDSQFLLLDGLHTLTLVHVTSKRQQVLLSDINAPIGSIGSASLEPDANALLQPVTNSVWSADSRHFLFLSRGRLLWQGQSLGSGKGLYTVSIDDAGRSQGMPVVVDTGSDSQAGWTYEDANTSFLF